MEFQEVLARRHSCRHYSDKSVPREVLSEVADAGRRAPSGCNLQPWRFIVVDDKSKRKKIAQAVYDEKTKVNGFAANIPAFIVIVHMPPVAVSELQQYLVGNCDENYLSGLDIGCAAMEMSMAATAAGLGSVIMGMIHQPTIREALQIPDNFNVPAILGLGYPARIPGRPRPRKASDDVIHWNTF